MTALHAPLAVPSPSEVEPQAVALFRATRPRQWLKSVLVLAAPTAAGVLLHARVEAAVLVAVAAFTLAAAGCYLINDVVDRELDRAHPVKRLRPVACGAVGTRPALLVGASLVCTGLVAAATQSAVLLMIVALYAGTTLAYAYRLKAVPWLELAIVASGFVLRALAGGIAASVPVSAWFLLVTTAAAVLIVVSKRLSEAIEAPTDPGRIRPVLRRYRLKDLRRVQIAAAGLLLLSYAGWAATRPTTASAVFAGVSLLPVSAVVWLWIRRSDQGRAGAPEDLLLGDRTLRFLVLVWALTFLVAVAASVGGR